MVDPQRDIDRILALAGSLGVRITHVAETHLHNDYVSGGLALAKLTGATYLVAADDHVGFDRKAVTDGDELTVSPRMRLRAVATPGHTFHHLSYVLDDDQGPVGVFTGGSLLFGTTGRTDLLGRRHAHALAEQQHASVRRLADLLPDGAQVWPTHGFGSFCSATQSDAPDSTIGRERSANPALRLETDDFVRQTLAGLDAYPAYYTHMGARNTVGADLIDLTPVDLAAARNGTPPHGLPRADVLLDVRMTNEWRTGHIDGAIHIPLPDLPHRLTEVPTGTVWVHCGSGYRAAAATSLLARAGRQVVHLDDAYPAAAHAGLPIVAGLPVVAEDRVVAEA